jgi:hypothetical protein
VRATPGPSSRQNESHTHSDSVGPYNLRPVELVFHEGVLTAEKARFVRADSHLRVRGQASLALVPPPRFHMLR